MYRFKTPTLAKALYASCVWSKPKKDNKVYLTFDDGPHPEITSEVLNMLEEFNAKATFFCVGKNVAKYPETYQRILDEGHSVGNHTHNHLNGFESSKEEYIKNVENASKLIDSELFRPPYGKIKTSQLKSIKKDYQIIMWSLIAGDWDISLTKEQCFYAIKQNIKSGDIVVLHDSEKAHEKMIFTLEKTLEFAKEKGFELAKL